MAALAGTTLLVPRTTLDSAWALNPSAYQQLTSIRNVAGPLFLLLSLLLIFSAVGWFRRRRWGWILAVAIISTQIIGDVVNLLRGDWQRGTVGVIVAGTLLLYLFTPGIRADFDLSPH
jgi:Na+/melibiose symporter-like transporter